MSGKILGNVMASLQGKVLDPLLILSEQKMKALPSCELVVEVSSTKEKEMNGLW